MKNSRDLIRKYIPLGEVKKLRSDLRNTEIAVAALVNHRLGIDRGLDDITQYGYRIHSQNAEDGIIQYLFSRIGTVNNTFVEFGIGDGSECNTANLAISHRWSGLQIDGGKTNVENAREISREKAGGRIKVECAFITKDNINDLIGEAGFQGEIDLLSIDIDGNDLWVWDALDIVSPRLLVIEYNANLGPTLDATIKYNPKHVWGGWQDLYFGASITALTRVSSEKGYCLVGTEASGTNAFFVRQDCVKDLDTHVPERAWRPRFLKPIQLTASDLERDKRGWDIR